MTSYHTEYEGYYSMSWHDQETNALKRWFDNYKIDRGATFAAETEWLIVKELPSRTKRKRCYVCEIGDDGRGRKREVIMDHSAPPAPMLTFAAKRRYEPPPSKTVAELHKESEYARMRRLGYEPVRRAKYKLPRVSFGPNFDITPNTSVAVEYEIEWVRSRPYSRFDVPARPVPPPSPSKHRRN
jgi:hypothetical protein